MDEFQDFSISCSELCEISPLGFVGTKRNLKQISYIKAFNLYRPVLLPQIVEPKHAEPILLENPNHFFFIGPAFNVWTINYEIGEDGRFQTIFAKKDDTYKVHSFVPCPATALNTLLSNHRGSEHSEVLNELTSPEDFQKANASEIRLFSSKRKRAKEFYFDSATFETDLFCYAIFFGENIRVSEELALNLGWSIGSSKELTKGPVQLASHRTTFVEANLIAAINTLF